VKAYIISRIGTDTSVLRRVLSELSVSSEDVFDPHPESTIAIGLQQRVLAADFAIVALDKSPDPQVSYEIGLCDSFPCFFPKVRSLRWLCQRPLEGPWRVVPIDCAGASDGIHPPSIRPCTVLYLLAPLFSTPSIIRRKSLACVVNSGNALKDLVIPKPNLLRSFGSIAGDA
jgi:hypothetical protein